MTPNALLPLRVLVITMEVIKESRPAFFHQAALMAFLRFLAKSPDNFDHYIRLDAPESGRIHYLPGDYYRFTLIGLEGSDPLLDTILQALARLPHTAPKTDTQIPFRDNWRLHGVQDAFMETPVERLSQATHYGWQQLQEEVELWCKEHTFTWRWLTPARLLKDKQQRKGAVNEARYCRDSHDLPGELLLCRLHDSVADLLRRRGETPANRRPPPPIVIDDAHLFWMDAQYRNPKGESKEMGGVTGRLNITLSTPLSRHWWTLLILGQYIGIGQRTAFGWGRYQLITASASLSCRRTRPAASLLSRVRQAENLTSAWRHVMSNTGDHPLSGETDEISEIGKEWQYGLEEEPSDAPLERLQRDVDKLISGKYLAPLLRGYLIPKRNNDVRPLAIPPVYDRVLQRALAQVLTPALEKLMYRHSHGYRPGRSRMTARYEIQAAWRAGYRWVYESDIEDFFDSVDLQRLRDRLTAIYGDDPLVEAILGWMGADVQFQDEIIQRKNGLPQGAPLSPLMANLMLDDFDSDMEKAGFYLIRFADDFIILCKDPERAQAAGEAARQSLQEHGLDLNPDKTRISAMESGFKYLGYLFVNDMALDISGTDKSAEEAPRQSPANSWLAQLGAREVTRIKQKEAATKIDQRQGRKIAIGEREHNGTLLALTGDHSVVSTLNKNLRVHRKEKLLYNLPWNSLQAVILFGNHQITTQAMRAAMRHNVPIHLSNGSGLYHGLVSSNQATQGEQVWLQQLRLVQDPDKALYCAREIVTARLIHMKENLRRRQQGHEPPQIDNAIRHANRADNLDSLRGLEGAATREYYQRLARILPEEIGFSGRNRRPPSDPFNVLLSLGYTVLYGYTQSIIHAAGLLPRQGFYHQPRGRHAALASDLMEPFRHMVERSAITVILRQEISAADFSYSPAGACIIDAKARRKYLSLLLSRWESGCKARGETESKTYFTHLYDQALSLKGFIREGTPFKAWRIR